MNPEAFRYFHVFPLMVRAHSRTEDGNNLLHSELLFKLITASPRATHPRFTGCLIRVYGPKPCPCAVNWFLLPYKSSGAFQKMNALVYVLKLTVCIDTEEIELIVDSVPKSIKADLIKGVLTIKIGCDCDRLSGHYKRGD